MIMTMNTLKKVHTIKQPSQIIISIDIFRSASSANFEMPKRRNEIGMSSDL